MGLARTQRSAAFSYLVVCEECMTRLLYFLTALLTGACVMALEMLGFRMFAPYFGYSIYVSGSLISVILFAMSLGYLLGGWLADRSRTDLPLYGCLFVASLAVWGIGWAGTPLLQRFQSMGLLQGTLASAFALFSLPMILLSTASPYLIKLLAHEDDVGLTAGEIVAFSTWGSIAGTLLASFVMIPRWGVRLSLLTLASVATGLALLGLLRHTRKALALLLGVGLFWLPPLPGQEILPPKFFEILWDTQSYYSRLLVVKDKQQQTIAVMPTYSFVHSEKKLGQRFSHSEQDVYSLGGLLHYPPQRILLLGLGAGTTFQQLRHFFPKAQIVGVDIDRTIVEAGRRFFGLKPDRNTRVVIADARRFLHQSPQRFDLIAINLTVGSVFLPYYMATREAFLSMRRHLTRKGWVLMNVVDPDPKRVLTRCIMKTMKSVFPFVYRVPFAANSVVFASRVPLYPRTMAGPLRHKHLTALAPLVKKAMRTIKPYYDVKACSLWTDNHSQLNAFTFRALKKSG